VRSIEEQPALRFDHYGIGVHVLARRDLVTPGRQHTIGGQLANPDALASYERDMLSYAYRDDPPFRTILSANAREVRLELLPVLEYASESRTVELRTATPPRELNYIAGVTIFERIDLDVLHLILLPRPESDYSSLSEYEIIKLAKLWEGGEEVSSHPASGDAAATVTFRRDCGEQALRLRELMARVFEEWELGDVSAPGYGRLTGTIQLSNPQAGPYGNVENLFEEICRLRIQPGTFELTEERAHRSIKAVGGIIQGLLDFDEIDYIELGDVFNSVAVDAGEISGFFKGSLLSIGAATDRDWQSPTGMSPYLLIPHAVILHNEGRLRAASNIHRRLPGASSERPTTGRMQAVLRAAAQVARRARNYPTIEETLGLIDEMSSEIGGQIPNVFHYSRERAVWESGHDTRGLRDYQNAVRGDLEIARENADTRQKRRTAKDVVIALVLSALGAVLAASAHQSHAVPLWVIAVIWLIVIAAYISYRSQQ
jgi:hypothetical protein